VRARDVTALPAASRDLARGLSHRPLAAFAPVYRGQFDRHGPWWWSRRPAFGYGGRVDLAAPDGTVYLATGPAPAIIEKLWDPGLRDAEDDTPQHVSSRTLDRIVVWQAQETDGSQLADVTDRPGGLPKEFSTAGYRTTQAWADAIRAHSLGCDGVVYWCRLDPGDGRTVALFATGPDDSASGFTHEPFAMTRSGRGSDLVAELPAALLVVDTPADDDILQAGDDAL
jgi:hypothetical protein